jgi:hypothetical protein
MRGDWVGTPRRAIPTADTHVNPGQGPNPISLPGWAEDEALWRVCSADFGRTRPV